MLSDEVRNSLPPGNRRLVAKVAARIGQFLTKSPTPILAAPVTASTETGAAEVNLASVSDMLWKVYYNRRAIWQDLTEMDETDPILATALDVIADCTVGYEDVGIDAFEWTFEHPSDAAQELLKQLKTRLDLGQESWHIVRDFVKNGEEFREVVVDGNWAIQRFKTLPSYQMSPAFDKFGNKQPGWEQRPDGQGPLKKIPFEEWQIIAFVYGARRGWFGTGLMLPARRTWRRLQKMEDGMALARMIRAYDKLLHRVPVKADWDLKRQQQAILDYKNAMTKKKGLDSSGNLTLRENPLSVETDFYIPDDGTKRGGIDPINAQNAQLQNIEDLRYHREMLMCRIKVPAKYLNIAQGSGALTEASLTSLDIQFARTLRQSQAVLRTGLLKLAAMQLMFAGLDAQQIGVGVQMATINTSDLLQDAKIEFSRAQSARIFQEVLGSFPPELLAAKYMRLNPRDRDLLDQWIVKNPDVEWGMPAPEGLGDRVDDRQRKRDDRSANRGDVKRPGTKDAFSPKQIAQSVARLQMLVQAELEQRGEKFAVGYEERVAQNLEAVLDEHAEDA